MIEGLKKLKREIGALYFAYKNPDTPWYAKVVAIIVVGYALSPIDLIPDFIPVLGYLDDAILLPIGIALAIKLIPDFIMEESRIRAEKEFEQNRKNNWIAAGIVIAIWILVIGLLFSGARYFIGDRADKQAKEYEAAVASLEGVERLNEDTEYNEEGEKTANCIVILSNQSYEDTEVVMSVYIDDIEVAKQECHTENQHKGYYYYFQMTGKHRIKVVADTGQYTDYEDLFSEDDQRWIVVSYWPDSEVLGRYVTEEPFGWK